MDYPQQPQRRGGSMFTRLIVIAVIGLVSVVGYMMQHSATGPYGRHQFRAIDEQQEDQLGLQAFQQVKAEEGAKGNILNPADPIVRQVREITQNLIAAAKQEDVCEQEFKLPVDQFNWDVQVIDSPQANAFCLPGGKMVVYTGILPIAQTDAALAAVIGHEISHALAHHGAERMAHEEIKNRGIASVGMGMGDMDPNQQRMILSAIGMAAKYGLLPYSRDHETEADKMGLVLMAAAGYDPREAVKFWERMEEQSGGSGVPEFMSTHPGHETRIAALRELQSHVAPFYNASAKRPTEPLRWNGSRKQAPQARIDF